MVTKLDVLNDAVELGITVSGKKSNNAVAGVASGYRNSIRIVKVA
jgi:hypothetical protein